MRGGSAVYTSTTDSSGLVTTTLLTANSHAGSYAVNANTTNGLNSVSFNLTNLAGPPSSLTVLSGNGQSAVVNTAFAQPFAVRVADAGDNPLGGLVVTFTAPAGGPSGTFTGGSAVYTGTTNSSGIVTSTTFSANGTSGGPYNVTGKVEGLASPVATFQLFNLAQCSSSLVTSDKDDGSCGTLREAIFIAGNSQSSQTVTITLSAGSVISLTTGLTLTNGVAITTTAPCGTGPNNTMVPPITLLGIGTNSGDRLTLAANNRLYGLWVRGFSGLQIHAPVGSHTIMQCVRASKT